MLANLRMATKRLFNLKPLELAGNLPQAYFHFRSVGNWALITKAEVSKLEEEETPMPAPAVEVVQMVNMD